MSATERERYIKYVLLLLLSRKLYWTLMKSPTRGSPHHHWRSQLGWYKCLDSLSPYRIWSSFTYLRGAGPLSPLCDMVMRLYGRTYRCHRRENAAAAASWSCLLYIDCLISHDVQASEWSTGKEANLLEWRLCPAAAVWPRRESTRSSIHPSIHPSM